MPGTPSLSRSHLDASVDLLAGTTTLDRTTGPAVVVFISFVMPKTAIKRLLDQAARVRATVVLRGLVSGSMRDTVARMQELIGTRKVAVQIDPQAFDRYSVARTPSFVLGRSGAQAQACADTAPARPTTSS